MCVYLCQEVSCRNNDHWSLMCHTSIYLDIFYMIAKNIARNVTLSVPYLRKKGFEPCFNEQCLKIIEIFSQSCQIFVINSENTGLQPGHSQYLTSKAWSSIPYMKSLTQSTSFHAILPDIGHYSVCLVIWEICFN